MEAFKDDCSPSTSANVQEVKHCPRPPDWRKGPFGRRGWGANCWSVLSRLISSLLNTTLRNAQETIYLWFRQSARPSAGRICIAREGLRARRCKARSATACSLESWAGSTKVCEPSQDGAGPPTLLFLFPPARKGVGKMKRLEAQR